MSLEITSFHFSSIPFTTERRGRVFSTLALYLEAPASNLGPKNGYPG